MSIYSWSLVTCLCHDISMSREIFFCDMFVSLIFYLTSDILMACQINVTNKKGIPLAILLDFLGGRCTLQTFEHF